MEKYRYMMMLKKSKTYNRMKENWKSVVCLKAIQEWQVCIF